MLTDPRSRLGITTCALLAALTACGGSSVRHTPSAAKASKAGAPAATTGAATAGASVSQWMKQFCADPLEHAALYIVEYKAAVQATESQLTVAELAPTKQVLSSTVSGLESETANNANQLASATPPKAADAARARTYLLGVYQQLDRALTAAQTRLRAVPTTNVRQFTAAFGPVADDLVAAIGRSQHAVQSNATLGPAFKANPKCVNGVAANLPPS